MFSHFGSISHAVEKNFHKECVWCGGGGAFEIESVWSKRTNPIVRTSCKSRRGDLSKIYIIFVKPFSNNPSPWFPGQILRGFKGLADWRVGKFLRGGGNPWVISMLSQLLHYPIVGVLSDSAMWPMWFLTPFSWSVTSKVWKAAADDNVILWSHDLDCDCDIVITRLKNHQHNLELVQLHSGVGVWGCLGGVKNKKGCLHWSGLPKIVSPGQWRSSKGKYPDVKSARYNECWKEGILTLFAFFMYIV